MRRRDDRGQVTLLIIGFASMLVMAVVMLVDASAAYLQRQGLDNLADGAALHGADLGSDGVYGDGLGTERLSQEAQAVRAAVMAYLEDTNAETRFPGIKVLVDVDPEGRSVTVSLEAPLELPLRVPGSPALPIIGASSTAAVSVLAETE